jgi:hypothetical protein
MEQKMLKTRDYDKFHHLDDNRGLIEKHIVELVTSLQVYDDLHLHPIIVTEDFGIIDGQHRHEAAKRLKKDIYYVIDYNFRSEKMLMIPKTQKSWVLDDIINYYSASGNENYKKFKELGKQLGWSSSLLAMWLCGRGNDDYRRINRGNFKFILNDKMNNAILAMTQINEFLVSKKFKPMSIVKSSAFHSAFKTMFLSDVVSTENLIRNFELYFFMFKNSGRKENFIENLVEIYNYRKKTGKIAYKKKEIVYEN